MNSTMQLSIWCLLLFVMPIITERERGGEEQLYECDFVPTEGEEDCSVGCYCYEFRIIKKRTVDDGTNTEITFEVMNNCKWDVSYIAIGTEGLIRIAPPSGSRYQGNLGTYKVEWTNLSGNPGFPSIKFEAPSGINFNKGGTEIFIIKVAGLLDPNYAIFLQGHGGAVWETFSGLHPHQCECPDCEEECPAGYTNLPECSECADEVETPGWTWWCTPQDSDIHPYALQLLNCTPDVNCPLEGFPPSRVTVDTDGYRVTCDCTRQEVECPNNCHGNGICNRATGECTCTSGRAPDCRNLPSTGTSECSSLEFCSGNGLCSSGKCSCNDPYEGESCNTIPSRSCSDFRTCGACSSSTFGCAWCLRGSSPVCVSQSECNNTNLLSCTPTLVTYTPEPCPDNCGAHGICVNGRCQCEEGYRGLNCMDDGLLQLTTEAVLAVGLTTGILVVIVIAAIVVATTMIGGSVAYYRYQRLRSQSMNHASVNPMYDDKGMSGTNPLAE